MLVQQDGKVACHQYTGDAAPLGQGIGQSFTYRWGELTWSGLDDGLGSGLGVCRCTAGVFEVVDGFPESGVLITAHAEQQGESDQGLAGLAQLPGQTPERVIA
ncbi:MAG TPA: hypothetical protein VGK53_18320 [Propionicimonas sp.]